MKTLAKSFKAVILGNADTIQLRNVFFVVIIPIMILIFMFIPHGKN